MEPFSDVRARTRLNCYLEQISRTRIVMNYNISKHQEFWEWCERKVYHILAFETFSGQKERAFSSLWRKHQTKTAISRIDSIVQKKMISFISTAAIFSNIQFIKFWSSSTGTSNLWTYLIEACSSVSGYFVKNRHL